MLDSEESRDEFEELYHNYKGMMYKIARYYTDNHHLAEEAMQSAFVAIAKCFDKIKSLKEPALEVYLCKVTKSHAISLLRKEHPFITKNVSLDPNILASDFIDPAISLSDKELVLKIIDYLKEIGTQYSEILTLHYIHGLTMRECSIVLGIPLSTAKTRLYRAQAMVKEKFKELKK
ncbi:MAG: sigma-70 family RNA polymerase sigma factor [Clostridia bacterium]|nr:sigma-70 family RNA polymerase sigma factor [Clostridia bacterium]